MELNELPIFPESPELVTTAATKTEGLDLLGLRVPAEQVATELLNGVTTVTPSVRYLSVRAWTISRFAELQKNSDQAGLIDLANKIECAVALSNLINNPSASGLIGRREAKILLDEDEKRFELRPLVKIPAFNVYAGPTYDLKICWTKERGLGITAERGQPLAKAVQDIFQKFPFMMALTPNNKPQSVTYDELSKLGKSFSIDKPTGDERKLLIESIIPVEPEDDETSRVSTYCLLLYLSQLSQADINENLVFTNVISHKLDRIPSSLHACCEGWVRFIIRDMLVAVHEAAVALVVRHIAETSDGKFRLHRNRVLSELTSNELHKGMEAFNIPIALLDKPINHFLNHCKKQLQNIYNSNSIARWQGGINELSIIKGALPTQAALITLPLAWFIACNRIKPGLINDMDNIDLDGSAALARMGIKEILIKEVDSWSESPETLRDIIVRLLNRSVDQHCRIAWSRLAREPLKDVSLLGVDGDEWIYCQDFRNGRASSRLYQAINWLEQLDLIDDKGITKEGQTILEERLNIVNSMNAGVK